MNLGESIRSARISKNLSGRELAHLADIDFTHLSKIEHGKRPSEKVVEKLAQALDLNKIELLALAGKLSAGDRQLIQKLSFQYPGLIPALFRKLQNEPQWIEQVLAQPNNFEFGLGK